MAASISDSRSRPAARSCERGGTRLRKRQATSGNFSEHQRDPTRSNFHVHTSQKKPSARSRSSSRSIRRSSQHSNRATRWVIRANSSNPVSLRLSEHGRSICRRITESRNWSSSEWGVTPRVQHGRQESEGVNLSFMISCFSPSRLSPHEAAKDVRKQIGRRFRPLKWFGMILGRGGAFPPSN